MPENIGETGEVVTVPPTVEAQKETVNTPAEEKSVQPKIESNHVPYLRFKEVNDKSKSKDAEITELKKKLAEREVPEADDLDGEDEMSKYTKLLTEKGVKPEVAESLAKVVKQMGKDRYAKETRKAAEKLEQSEKATAERASKAASDIKEWRGQLEKAHPDHAEFAKEMEEEWNNLDGAAQMALVSSPKGHELLYKAAKASKVDKARVEGEEAGRNSAYESKGLKAAVSSKPGATATSGKKFTAEDLAGMDSETYKANREQIYRDLGVKK